jgi:hypothetical protein
MALSIGFRVSVSLHPAIQATGRLALAPAELAPASRTCLSLDTRSPGRPQQHRLGDREAKRLRGLEVDHELKLGGLLDGQVAEECLFPEVESLATRMKGLALCGEDLFSSFFGYVLQ